MAGLVSLLQRGVNAARTPELKKKVVPVAIVAAVALLAFVGWLAVRPSGPGAGFVSGNGRIEATEIDVATKLAGRVVAIMVNEGDFVRAGDPLAQMQVDVLDAQHDEALAQSQQAVNAVTSADAQVVARQSDTVAAEAVVGQRTSELDAAQRRLVRTELLTKKGVTPMQELDDDRASVRGAEAALAGAEAQVAATRAAIKAAQAEVVGAGSAVAATRATIARVEADIEDSQLKSPRDGRVQYRVAQPGEVLAAGGTVLNLVDLGDVYMTFFLPETAVGKLALGSEVRIVLDAVPQYVIPTTVSYVASTAQFTPKTVETASERQKLMFRVKAQIGRDLLQKNLKIVKTGLPGMAWVKLDPLAVWPSNLEIKLPQ
ncbi:MAG: HlyD family secretion protein [Terrimicrobiaceae bacterium]